MRLHEPPGLCVSPDHNLHRTHMEGFQSSRLYWVYDYFYLAGFEVEKDKISLKVIHLPLSPTRWD